MSDLSLDEWKVFLKARLQQEAGRDAEALATFNQLSEVKADNAHVQASRAFALSRLNNGPASSALRIGAAYSKAAASLVGDADTPEAWTAELNSLLSELDGVQKGRPVSASFVVW